MTSFGIMQSSFMHEQNYIERIAQEGSSLGYSIYRFLPDQIALNDISGLTYDRSLQTWKRATFPVPDFIYDRCFYPANKQENQSSFVHWLKNQTNATFLGYGLPGKWIIYKYLKSDPLLRRHLPKTLKLQRHTSARILTDWFKNHNTLILKPIIGSQGNGLIHITKTSHKISIQINHKGNVTHHTYDTTSSFLNFVTRMLYKRNYMAQQMLKLLDERQRPFDRRVVLKKRANCMWCELGRAMRVGKEQSFVSNLHSGGSIEQDDQVAIPSEVLLAADEKITQLASHIATLLEKKFPPLFELGLDFGIDQSGKVWLLEANSKPGHQIIQSHVNYPALLFEYCGSLLNEKEGVKKI
ncbi:YheC/YheD family protein [Pseudalkalibacillus hwajinpoensis]|uniref:YheC/YheD family protein n=1 Tax=Guptibacillus hwajinpoensis TaxID=208199 RepID=A0A4U1MC41_9BACL|nr:YheC/YheD family protein [Pseudalkalibacillus hwajinpoensis]TKD68669.1 YheC/YheD family protein [Pseudalkalibacillus hwajinpoensis]